MQNVHPTCLQQNKKKKLEKEWIHPLKLLWIIYLIWKYTKKMEKTAIKYTLTSTVEHKTDLQC